MGCCNELATALDTAVFDPTQHVNFAKGMVLGVDDFRQEFAYLSGRDQWLLRDAIGYGTASGLRVVVEDGGADGPRLRVTAGSAIVPSGRQVCVNADQCAVINKWLAKPGNAAIVNQLLNPGSPPLSPPFSPPFSPPMGPPGATSGTIALHLTLCYDDCLTRPVPVPGEPCRSEDELMADSRVADDFRLELRKDAPAQVEEDALRDFVKWLRANVQVVDASPPPIGDGASWLEALRPAAQPWLDAAAMSPPMSPPASFATLGDYLSDLSPLGLAVGRGQLCEFLRVAFRFWVTELRPMWTARRCHRPMVKDQDCILLARLEFDVDWVGGSPAGAWQVVGSPPAVVVDEAARPFIVHLRLLQEWLTCGCECGGPGTAAPAIQAPAMPPSGTLEYLLVLKADTPNLVLDDSHYCVVCKGPFTINLTLPASVPASAGRVFVIRNVDATKVTVFPDSATTNKVDDKAKLPVKTKTAVTLIADGEGGWQVIGMAG
jgi:hypothetical protein